MANALEMPKLSQTMEEGSIVKWHKKEGDTVKKGDIIFEIETDKAVIEVESFFEGTLLKIVVPEGQVVPVASTVGFIGQPGEKIPEVVPPPSSAQPTAQELPKQTAVKPSAPVQQEKVPTKTEISSIPAKKMPESKPVASAPERLKISPRAKALAQSCAIDPSRIRGTGPGGRIVEEDVEAYLAQNKYNEIKITPAAKTLAIKEKIDILRIKGTGDGGRITVADIENAIAEKPKPMSKMRQIIAQRLTQSFSEIPHFYVTVSADMTELMAFRQELKAAGKTFTVTDFILEAVILTLKEFPKLNSRTDGQTVSWRSKVDLGMAVSLEDGLVVPVIRNAEDLSMLELHDIAQDLAGRARQNKLLPDEMTGSSFTVSNMGMMNVENFNAIINPGEAGILAVSSTIPQPVVKDNKIVIRSIMKMTLSADHRIVDGSEAALFINAIKTKLEDIKLWKSLTL